MIFEVIADLKSQSCFKLGSLMNEVRAVQGIPTSINKYKGFETWSYKYSSITFENGRVTEYSNISNNLKICDFPRNYTNLDCFTIGSTKAVVSSVQGTPTSINKYTGFETWSYSYSSITFENGTVTGYSNISNNLKLCSGANDRLELKPIYQETTINTNNNDDEEDDDNEFDLDSEDLNSYNSNNSIKKDDEFDIGFKPFIGQITSKVNFRSGPSQSNSIIKSLTAGSQIYIYSNKTINNYYKAIDINTSIIGWVHKDYVRYIEDVEVNYEGAFQSTGYVSNYDSEVNIKNKSAYTIKLIVGSETFTLSPNSLKTVNIKPGNKYYIATAPGVIPASGYQKFDSNNGYEWEFWVSTTRY